MRYTPENNMFEVVPDKIDSPTLASLCKQLSFFRENNIEVLKPYFDDLLSSGEINGMLNSDLTDLLNNPMRGFRSVAPKRYTIFRNSNYALRLLIEERADQKVSPLTTASSSSVWGVVSDGCEVAVDKYKLPVGTSIDVFDPNVSLVLESHVELTANTNSVTIHASDVFSVSSRNRVAILALSEVPALPYVWEFERESLKPMLIQAVAPSISRLEVAIDVLSCLAEENDVSKSTKERCEYALKQLTGNPHHFIRWKAVQALFQLNEILGMDALRHAGCDPHPHVRQAALASLANISGHFEVEADAGV